MAPLGFSFGHSFCESLNFSVTLVIVSCISIYPPPPPHCMSLFLDSPKEAQVLNEHSIKSFTSNHLKGRTFERWLQSWTLTPPSQSSCQLQPWDSWPLCWSAFWWPPPCSTSPQLNDDKGPGHFRLERLLQNRPSTRKPTQIRSITATSTTSTTSTSSGRGTWLISRNTKTRISKKVGAEELRPGCRCYCLWQL